MDERYGVGLNSPEEYDGETLCPCCGRGLQTGKQYAICADGPTHEESCATYTYSDDSLCPICESVLS